MRSTSFRQQRAECETINQLDHWDNNSGDRACDDYRSKIKITAVGPRLFVYIGIPCYVLSNHETRRPRELCSNFWARHSIAPMNEELQSNFPISRHLLEFKFSNASGILYKVHNQYGMRSRKIVVTINTRNDQNRWRRGREGMIKHLTLHWYFAWLFHN